MWQLSVQLFECDPAAHLQGFLCYKFARSLLEQPHQTKVLSAWESPGIQFESLTWGSTETGGILCIERSVLAVYVGCALIVLG